MNHSPASAPLSINQSFLAAMLAPRAVALELRHRAAKPLAFTFCGVPAKLRASAADADGECALVDVDAPDADAVLRLAHAREDQAVFVLEGRATFHVGSHAVDAGPGDFVWLPRGVSHALRVRSAQLSALLFVSPAGFQNYFRKAADCDDDSTSDADAEDALIESISR